MEKTIVLEFGLLLRDKIEKTGKYRVLMTHVPTVFLRAARRAGRVCARSRASLFISIHADALPRGGERARGQRLYAVDGIGFRSGAAGRDREPGRM